MKLDVKLFFLLCSLLFSTNIFCQTDSTILIYPNKILSPSVMYRNFKLELDTTSFQSQSISIGARIRFKKFALGLSIPIINNENLGNTDDIKAIGINGDVFGQRHSIHILARYYDVFPNGFELKSTQPIGYLHLQSSHILNKSFSYRSAYRLFDQQLISKGGLSISPEIFYYYISQNQAFVNTVSHLMQFRGSLGYAHNFILKEHYFLSFYLNTGYAFDFQRENQNIELLSSHFTWLTNAKMAFGYQSKEIAWSLIANYTPSQFRTNNFKTSHFYIGFLIGLRLNSTFKE